MTPLAVSKTLTTDSLVTSGRGCLVDTGQHGKPVVGVVLAKPLRLVLF